MANIICDGGRQNVLLLKSGIRQRYLLWTRLLNIILEFSDRVIREGKRIIKGTQIGKAEIKLSLTAGNTIGYIKKNQMESINENYTESTNEFTTTWGHTVSCYFYILATNR